MIIDRRVNAVFGHRVPLWGVRSPVMEGARKDSRTSGKKKVGCVVNPFSTHEQRCEKGFAHLR